MVSDPLALLHDMHVPSLLPLAINLCLLIGMSCFGIRIIVYRVQAFRQGKVRRRALRCLHTIEKDGRMGKLSMGYVAMKISCLLRQVATHYHPHCIGFVGILWIDFLKKTYRHKFDEHLIRCAPYQAKGDALALCAFCQSWIQQQGR